MPPIISVTLYTINIHIDNIIILKDDNDHQYSYNLQGIVYFGGAHFVSRIIDTNFDVWYNDGISTKRKYIKEMPLREFSKTKLHYLKIGNSIFHSCFAVYSKN